MKTIYSFKGKLPDLSGVCFSSLCGLHCMAMPAISALLVMPEDSTRWFHALMLGVGLPLMFISIVDNRRKGVSWPSSAFLALGWILFIYSEYFMEEENRIVQVIAGMLISAGHLMGLWFKRGVSLPFTEKGYVGRSLSSQERTETL